MSHLVQCYMNVMPSCYVSSQSVLCECDATMLYVASRCIAIMLCPISVYCHVGASLKYENVVFNGEQKKESFV